jgi:hypothetical protein
MAKDIPYFKFYINEWINGDITLEEMEIQGVFINICAYYWSKDCELNLNNLKKKFRGYESKIDALIESGIIKVNNQEIVIMFLNEQLQSKAVQQITNRQNGSLGGRPKKITEEKPNGLFLETKSKAKENQNITNIKERKEKKIVYTPFIDEVIIYFTENGYTKESAVKAFNYYQENNWKDSRNNQVKNWKKKMQGVWFKEENKIKNEQLPAHLTRLLN